MSQEQKSNTIRNEKFGGERPLFATHDLRLENVTITDGESGIKQCQDMEAYDCKFYGKYPWWHVDGAKIDNCYFAEGSRSAIWYTNDLVMTNSRIDGPKFFREMKNLTLENVEITDADETFWKVNGIRIRNVKLHGAPIPLCSHRISMSTDLKATRNMCSNTARTWRFIMQTF